MYGGSDSLPFDLGSWKKNDLLISGVFCTRARRLVAYWYSLYKIKYSQSGINDCARIFCIPVAMKVVVNSQV